MAMSEFEVGIAHPDCVQLTSAMFSIIFFKSLLVQHLYT